MNKLTAQLISNRKFFPLIKSGCYSNYCETWIGALHSLSIRGLLTLPFSISEYHHNIFLYLVPYVCFYVYPYTGSHIKTLGNIIGSYIPVWRLSRIVVLRNTSICMPVHLYCLSIRTEFYGPTPVSYMNSLKASISSILLYYLLFVDHSIVVRSRSSYFIN